MGQSASSIHFEETNPLANAELAIQQVTGGTLKDGIFLMEYADGEIEKGIILFEVENLKYGVLYQTSDGKNSLRRQSHTEIKINEQVVRISKKVVPSNPQIEIELREIEESQQPLPPILYDTEDLEIQYKFKRENDEKQKLEKRKGSRKKESRRN